jgi:hypothetical protein
MKKSSPHFLRLIKFSFSAADRAVVELLLLEIGTVLAFTLPS